ncbi:hypothetical protein ACHAQA_000720 [Verticillium albo-atrum]
MAAPAVTQAAATMVNLPTEILHDIFDSFWERSVVIRGYHVDWGLSDDLGKVNWQFVNDRLAKGVGLEAIQNLRLVCSRFNHIASPLLFPVISVGINQESLDRLDAISRNPVFADSLRGVQVNLRYYVPELAFSLPLFRESCSRLLEDLSCTADYYSAPHIFRGLSPEEDTEDSREFSVLVDVMHSCILIDAAWDKLFKEPMEEKPQNNTMQSDDQQLLLEAFRMYIKAYEDQSQLLNNGTFVKTVAAAMARMPRAVCLSFSDSSPPEKSFSEYLAERKSIFDFRDTFLRLLAAPSVWSAIESMTLDRGTEMLPVQIISDLPVALHQAGASLRELSLGCFPQQSNFYFLRPSPSVCAGADPWDALTAACSNLESFHFGRGGGDNLHGLTIRYEHISGDNKTNVERYLGAMLSSSHLEEVALDLRPFSLNTGLGSQDDWFDASSIIGTPTWQNLQRFRMSNVKVNKRALLAIIGGLGHRLRSFSLHSIDLTRGNWLPAMDILRAKVAASLASRNGKGRVHISFQPSFKGGEFGRAPPLQPVDYGSWKPNAKTSREKRQALVLEKLQEYLLLGGVNENPLRGAKRIK